MGEHEHRPERFRGTCGEQVSTGAIVARAETHMGPAYRRCACLLGVHSDTMFHHLEGYLPAGRN